MLPVRQVLSAKEIDALKSCLDRIISTSSNNIDWTNLASIKEAISTYKVAVPKELDKFDNESTLLQVEREVECVLSLEEKIDKEMSEYTTRINTAKERILSKLK